MMPSFLPGRLVRPLFGAEDNSGFLVPVDLASALVKLVEARPAPKFAHGVSPTAFRLLQIFWRWGTLQMSVSGVPHNRWI
jgi:hypothetical protein